MVPVVHRVARDPRLRLFLSLCFPAEAMRFEDDEGRSWTIRDVALLPERTLVEAGHPQAVERYFENVMNEKRVYYFREGEPRSLRPEYLRRQLRGADVQRQSDPNLFKV